MEINSSWATRPGPEVQSCANGCVPGVVDSWVDILFNILLQVVPGAVEAGNIPTKKWDVPCPLNYYKSFSPFRVSKEGLASYPQLEKVIPGTPRNSAEADSLEKLFRCFTHNGNWIFNNTPRPLPWAFGLDGKFSPSICDLRQMWAGGVAGPTADDIARNPNATKDTWNVPPHTLWEWKTSEECPLASFSRDTFCK